MDFRRAAGDRELSLAGIRIKSWDFPGTRCRDLAPRNNRRVYVLHVAKVERREHLPAAGKIHIYAFRVRCKIYVIARCRARKVCLRTARELAKAIRLNAADTCRVNAHILRELANGDVARILTVAHIDRRRVRACIDTQRVGHGVRDACPASCVARSQPIE